jgi:hypothetical protein
MSSCRILFFLLFFFTSRIFSGQESQQRSPMLKTAGLVAYYLWEEDSLGNIKPQTYCQPFLQNYCILRNSTLGCKKQPKVSHVQAMIKQFAHDNTRHYKRNKFKTKTNDSIRGSETFPLQKFKCKGGESVIYVFKNGKWHSLRRHTVNYFIKYDNGLMRYSHSNDSISFISGKTSQKANAHYTVYIIKNQLEETKHQQIYNYAGQDVTDQFEANVSTSAIRTLVFANGYRGPKKEKDHSDGLITQKDRYFYWYKIDNQFIAKLQPNASFYIDGSFSIRTSVHKNKLKFACSIIRSRFSGKKAKSKRNYKALNQSNNPDGFQERKTKGKLAGEVFLLAKCYTPDCQDTKDTVDIVCHSMGYAYALGFIETIQARVILGNMYIIAPESGNLEGMDWGLFQEVWQYGSNLGEVNQDPARQQDGISPQTPVKYLTDTEVSGRVFIPSDWPSKNFIDSHMIYNYQWIFDRLQPGNKGFVHKKT